MAMNQTSCVLRVFHHNLPSSAVPALRCFHTSQMLGHDPNLKKKKKQAVDQAKEKIRKDKQAAKRKAEPIIIPVDPDAVTDPILLENSRKRQTPDLSSEVVEERILLSKEWARHTMKTHREELNKLQVRARSRQDALNELKKISMDLYNEAIKVNRTIYPLVLNGPVETPAFDEYIAPDLDDVNIKKMRKA